MNFEEQKQLKQRSMAILNCWSLLAGKTNVSEDDAKKYYDQNQKQFQNPEQVRASHILVSVKKTDPNEVKAKARAKIEALLAKIKAGADFAELPKPIPTTLVRQKMAVTSISSPRARWWSLLIKWLLN